jgi:DNA topoisomerase-1
MTIVRAEVTVRVRIVSDDGPGIRREPCRDAFRYRDPAGRLVRDANTLARIRALAVPPAWADVWICPTPGGHVQATGRDAKGRKQYRYHTAFRAQRNGTKFDALTAFAAALPRLRRRVAADLRRPGLPREKVLAAVVRLLDRTHIRVGNAEYAKANGSFGLSTLRDGHARFDGATVRLRFRGKSGVWHDRAVTDRRLAGIVRACRDLPGQELFQYVGDGGAVRDVGSGDVNDYIRIAAGGEFTAKVFRTWAGTVKAAVALAARPADTAAARKKAVVAVIREVAGALGNTPAVCRSSYVHPAVIDAYLTGELALRAAAGGRGLSADEARVLRFLTGAGRS